MKNKYDTIISGAGIYGLLIAKKLSKIYPEMKIVILEEKKNLFNNNSTFNSGVLHSGIYYKPNSLKSKFCIKGNDEMREFIKENGLFHMDTGKLILASSEKESYKINDLYQNGIRNGVHVELLKPNEAKKIDNCVTTEFNSLYLPTASIGNPAQVIGKI